MFGHSLQAALPEVVFAVPPVPTFSQSAPPPGAGEFTTAHKVAWGLGVTTIVILLGAVFFGRDD